MIHGGVKDCNKLQNGVSTEDLEITTESVEANQENVSIHLSERTIVPILKPAKQ